MAAEFFDDTSPTVHEVGITACSTPRSSSDKSQFQSSATRSAISSAASTSDTISSNEEVHNYEEWELGFDVEDDAKGLSNTDDNLESSTESNSQSPKCNPRSEQKSANSASDDASFECEEEEETSEENQNESHQDDGDQSVQEHPETARTFEESKSEIESARSTSESSSWADEHQVSENSVKHHQYLSSRSEDDPRGDLEMLSQPVTVADPSTDAKDRGVDRHTSSYDNRLRDQGPKSARKNIQVFVRVRPLPARHNDSRDEAQVVKLGDDSNSIRVQAPSNHGANCVVTECSFDKVFLGGSTQEDVFSAVQPSIRASLDGYNATVFAYGQTGTGKTHTIFGEEADVNFLAAGKEDSENSPRSTNPTWGIIPRAIALLLDQAEALSNMDAIVSLQCSFMQIYNDRLFDLLTDRRRQRPLIIREQPTLEGGTNVVLQGLSSERITTLDEALQVLHRGRANRSVRETELNSCSSRSHAIVQINITSECTLKNGDKLIRKSRLNLVDLAGSEKWNTDIEMEDAHSQELKNINTSLSALGNCIAALSETGRRHIPYRDSTLTRLLQDSFGGNTQACLIATISPSVRACDETIRTLQFADRARSVMQSVRVNEAVSGVSELQIAKAQISKLREKLESEQRRRHQTRVNEQEAAQKDFLEKLQMKEKEIQKLARDNAVFSRWREEDLRKIRELESRVKELEVVTQVDVNAEVNGSLDTDWPDDLTSGTQAPLKRHDEKENLLVTTRRNEVVPPQAGIKKTNSKKSISSGVLTMKKDDTAAIKPYRQILERYALGSKKSNRRHAERQPNEAVTTPSSVSLNRNNQQAETQELVQAGVASNDSNQRMRERDNQDAVLAPDGRREMASTATYHGTSDVHIKRKSQDPLEIKCLVEKSFDLSQRSVNSNDTSPVAETIYTSAWQPNAVTSYSTPASYKNEDPAASASSNWRSQTNLFDQAYRSYLQPSPSPLSIPEPIGKKDRLIETGSQYLRGSVPAVSSVPDFKKTGTSSTTRESSNFVVPFPTSSLAATSNLGSSDPCEKHSLKGCVLCAVRDTRSQTTLTNKPSALASMASASTELSLSMTRAKPVVVAARDGPCDRHHLASCFICGSSSGSASLGQSAVETRLSSIGNPFQQVSSRYEEDNSSSAAAAADRNPLLMNDSKCDAHSLANCVLCVGVKAMARKIQHGSPTRKAFPLDASTAASNSAAAWTSNRNLVLADRSSPGEGSVAPSGSSFMPSGEQQQVSSPYSFNSTTQQHPLLRRHSVDYGSYGDSEGSTSPVKLLVHLRPQQSAVNLHSTANDLASSNCITAPSVLNQSRIPGGTPHEATSTFSDPLPYLSNKTQSNGTAAGVGNTPVQSSSPVKTNWQPAARPSIKELAVDSNRKSYQALIREASDAAAFVLRRK